MPAGYTVEASDGKEYGPVDRDTLQLWYREGRIDRNSRVWEPGGHKFRLHEMFDLAVWDNPALITQALAPPSEAGVATGIGQVMGVQPRERTPGMLAAGILLIIQGVIGLLSIAVILSRHITTAFGPAGFFIPVVDLVVAGGLLRGNESFRRWGLFRAVAGGLFFLVGALGASLTTTPSNFAPPLFTLTGAFTALFQLIFCAGIAALLWGEWPSKMRVVIGVAAVLVAWSGIFTWNIVAGLMGAFDDQKEMAAPYFASAGSSFEDSELGVNVRLPNGWNLVKKDDPNLKVPGAQLVAVHSQSGCFAALMVEHDSLGAAGLDKYLDLVLENRRKTTPSMTEVTRSDGTLGGNRSRTLETRWNQDGNIFRGFSTACKSGFNYYLLSGWCQDKSYADAHKQFQSLEQAFEIRREATTRVPDITSEADADFSDLVFLVRDDKPSGNTGHLVTVQGLYKGKQVGFQILFQGAGADAQLSIVKFKSIGEESDRFVRALDEIYKTAQSPKKMRAEIEFSAFNLEGDPDQIESGLLKEKLFFQTEDEKRYAELFIDVDLKSRQFYLSEKDPGFRSAIIRDLKSQ